MFNVIHFLCSCLHTDFISTYWAVVGYAILDILATCSHLQGASICQYVVNIHILALYNSQLMYSMTKIIQVKIHVKY